MIVQVSKEKLLSSKIETLYWQEYKWLLAQLVR